MPPERRPAPRPPLRRDAQPLRRRLAVGLLLVALQPAWAGDDCDVPPQDWQPRSAVSALARRNGWQLDRLKIDDGCYEISGRDAEGRRFKAKLDPASLQVLRFKPGHRERERERERHRDGPASAPRPASAAVHGAAAAAAVEQG